MCQATSQFPQLAHFPRPFGDPGHSEKLHASAVRVIHFQPSPRVELTLRQEALSAAVSSELQGGDKPFRPTTDHKDQHLRWIA
jgi:hypothetical protein